MTRIFRFLCLAAFLFLPACSYFETEGPETSGGQVNLMQDDAEDVEVYNLDMSSDTLDPGVIPSERESAQPAYSDDPSVEIFPLDGAGSVNSFEPDYADDEPIFAERIDDPSDVTYTAVEEEEPAMLTPTDGTAAVILFDHATASLDSSGVSTVKGVADRYGGGPVFVTGHASVESDITDPVERKISNLKISMNRAFNVAQILMRSGVPGDAIAVSGAGDNEAPSGSDDPSSARRVEISMQRRQ